LSFFHFYANQYSILVTQFKQKTSLVYIKAKYKNKMPSS